jgi:transposase
MQAVTTIGFDIAKSVFQVHGVDTVGQVIIRRQLKRRQVIAFFQKLPACLVGIEACALYVSSCDCCTESSQPVAIGRGPYTSTHGTKRTSQS